MLELKKITKSYKVGEVRQQVLKGIDIQFRRNEFTSILGSSGSGKTTLLNIIGGLDKYDDGDLIIEGVSTKKYRARDWDSYRNYRVGFIFQSYNLIMHQSILQNVEIALTLSGVSKDERRQKAIDALKRVGLEEHINKKPNQLSGGQMQRVAIARALVNDPEIILADEPTGALDSKTSVQIMDLLKEIAKDKLVIMVTHNPELAKEYSTRIIELKDGKIMNDSNPYKAKDEKFKERTIKKTSMSLISALSLSFNNLLTKMGRTFLTAFAGSIGIIGIALILALSNGVKIMASNLEKDSLTDYPFTIERVSYDLFGAISLGTSTPEKCEKGKICSKDDVVKQSIVDTNKGLVTRNNLVEFKKYIEGSKEFQNNAAEIIYSYDLDLQIYSMDHQKVNPSDLISDNNKEIFKELTTKENSLKLLAGNFPKEDNELLLVIPKNGFLNDSLLYSLGMKDKATLVEDFVKIRNDHKYQVESTTFSYDDFLNKSYKLLLNTDYYQEQNGVYIDLSNDADYLNERIDNGRTITIVGVVEAEGDSDGYIGYSHSLKEKVLEDISTTAIYKKQIANKEVNVLTGEEFDSVYNTYEAIAKKLGIYEKDDPSSITIYLKDYKSKEKIASLIKQYNKDRKKEKREDLVINYNDIMKSLVGGINTIVGVISIVLIGFVAISLLVSSIMIAIITYISVLERTKEIGILRAIGASKKDVKRVFLAETIIEGFVAGALGIFIALLICILINLIANAFGNVGSIANMPIMGAIFLILLSIALNVLAGLKPSSMAASKDPVEALRSE